MTRLISHVCLLVVLIMVTATAAMERCAFVGSGAVRRRGLALRPSVAAPRTKGTVLHVSVTPMLDTVPQVTSAPSTLTTAAGTLDPTTVLSDILGTVLGTPLILAVPIVAALLVATLIAYLIVAYASPAEEE